MWFLFRVQDLSAHADNKNNLQNKDFWFFLNKSNNSKPTKIEFIFDFFIEVTHFQGISNSLQTKRVGMIGYGLEIVDYVNY